MDLDLTGRTTLGARGNGRAIAHELADLSASVIVNDLDADPAAEVVEELRELISVRLYCPSFVGYLT